MEKKPKIQKDKILNLFEKFETVITIFLGLIIALTVIISVIRVSENFITLFLRDFFKPEVITYEDYQKIFGKIMTLLISLEFLSSILKVLKTHEMRTLILDITLIAALAIVRKLIIFDYEHHQPMEVIAIGGILLATGIFYFLIKTAEKNNL